MFLLGIDDLQFKSDLLLLSAERGRVEGVLQNYYMTQQINVCVDEILKSTCTLSTLPTSFSYLKTIEL